VGDGGATRKFFLRSLLVDMNPLFVARRLRKEIDTFLISIHSLVPSSVPTAALNSLKSLKMRIAGPHARSDQIFISGTLAGMNKSASVTAMTSATVTPGAVS